VPVPVAMEGARVAKEPWMRSFWSLELWIRLGIYLVLLYA